jgi:hypothetical protein
MNKLTTPDPRINELFSTITNVSHSKNINKEAFNDISSVLLSFHDKRSLEGIKQVCNASMGHGKTTVLISYLKWITKQKTKQPVLIAIREKQLAHKIYKEVLKVSPNAIINVDAENKEVYEADLHKYQIVIIQHQRLKNFALGFGNVYDYSYFVRDKAHWGHSNATERIKRLLVIDEKPDFADSALFDITSENNVLEWFDHLAEPLKILPRTLQKHKSYVTFLLSEELADNEKDITRSLFKDEDKNGQRAKNLISILDGMKEHEENKNKYESLNKLKHFKKLLKENGYGRIDDYSFGAIGRKIIISKYIDYSSLGMNVLIFDGTAKANSFQYLKGKYQPAIIENRNDYSRLTIQTDKINTSKYSRSKKGNPTQKAIAGRIRELKKTDKNLFILPMKDERNIYINEETINEKDKHFYYDDKEKNLKGINLLNTIGKNILNNKTSLYLTCLPKRNADYYKQIAIALYDNDVFLLTSDDSDNSNWFQDDKLEQVYRGELYAEILQIIHRTALRNINNNDKINIYIAFDDEPNNSHFITTSYESITENINRVHLNNKAVLPDSHKIYDVSLYGRDKKIEAFSKLIKNKLKQSEQKEISVSKVGQSFNNYIKKHWNTQSNVIINELASYGINIYIDESDKRKPKKVKLI